jgi:serine/threonine protein kinase
MEPRRFEIVGVLGTGSHGLVVLARDHADASPDPVGLKVLRSIEAESIELDRLRDEARILAWLSHPNIVKVHRLLEKDGLPIVVLEHVEGASAEELRARGPLPLPVAAAICHQAAVALDAAYNAAGPDGRPMRIVHGDIKPANLVVGKAGTVKVIDFGTAVLGAGVDVSASKDVAALLATLRVLADGDAPALPAGPIPEVAAALASLADPEALAAWAADAVPPIVKARSKVHFRGPQWRDLDFLEQGVDVHELDLGARPRATALRPTEPPEDVEAHLKVLARRPPWAVFRARPSPEALVEALHALKGSRDPRAVVRAHQLTNHGDPRVVEAAWELLASVC